MKTAIAVILTATLLLSSACSKTTVNPNQWTLGSKVFPVGGFTNYESTAPSVIFNAFTDQPLGASGNVYCKINFLSGSQPPVTGAYPITSTGTVGFNIEVTDSSGHTYISGMSNQSATVSVLETVFPHGTNEYSVKSVTIPAIWVYNRSQPSDSIKLSATLRQN
jgi:hypothetical protein